MSYDQQPENPISPEDALAIIRSFIDERSASGVMMADAFTEITLTNGTLTATWSEDALGQIKSRTLLGLTPFDNLAAFIGTPMSFDNEEGRQIRQHVRSISVIGPFGVGTMSARELYERGTGLP